MMRPSVDLRLVPSSTGWPKSRRAPRRRRVTRFWAGPFPKPKPGSRISCSGGMPSARPRAATAAISSRNSSAKLAACSPVATSLRLCITTIGTPRAAASCSISSLERVPQMSFSMCAPASSAAAATSTFWVSALSANVGSTRRSRSMAGISRAISSAAEISVWPGRVDSAPRSSRSVPSRTASRASCSTRSRKSFVESLGAMRPSPEKLSGVRFATAMM